MLDQVRHLPTGRGTSFVPPPPDSSGGETEFDWRRTMHILVAGRRMIAMVVLATLFLALAFFVLFPPTYKATGLIQVEQDKEATRPANVTGNQSISYDINGNALQSEGEIEVLQSRMVALEVIKRLNLSIDARPNTFPIIGNAIFRSNSGLEEPLEVPDLLRHFAWGGERIDVRQFDVPDSLQDEKFLVRVTENGYDLIDPDGHKVLEGRLGELAKSGSISILVAGIKARWGTTFKLTRVALQTATENLEDHLSVAEKVKGSGVIELSFKSKFPEVAAAVIDNVEDIYLSRNNEWRSARAEELQDTLKAQLPRLQAQVDKAQQQLKAYQLEHGSVDVSQETQLLLQHGVDLETSRLALLQQREEAMQRFTASHPIVVGIDEKLSSIDAELKKLKVDSTRLPLTQQDMLNRTRDLDVANELYTAMLNTIQQQQVIQAGTSGKVGGNVRIVDDALLPEKPSFPKLKILLPAAIVLGLLLGIALVLARNFRINPVYDESEIERRLGLAILGRVPHSRMQKKLMAKLRNGKIDSHVLANSVPDDAAVESLRGLRNALHFATQKSSNNIIVIAGPTKGIGKSFVALNLATLLALTGKRVALIDTDVFGGNLHKLTHLASSPGITDYVLEAVAPGGILQPTGITGLSLISQGTRRPNSSELLSNEAFPKLLKFLAGRYDHIIIDTPGNLDTATAGIVAQFAGCTLLVLKAGANSFEQVKESHRRLIHAGANVRGVVFNEIH